jgi:hypothetical protein
MSEMLSLMGGGTRLVVPFIEGDEHGIRNGWFNHPFNFDPTWLRRCDGFEANDEQLPA